MDLCSQDIFIDFIDASRKKSYHKKGSWDAFVICKDIYGAIKHLFFYTLLLKIGAKARYRIYSPKLWKKNVE